MSHAPKRPRLLALAAVAAAGTALASCAYPTPYQPATGSGINREGYSDVQIERDRFRVSFAGNSLTSRETVERYLLFRAAQLTLEQGYDHFILAERDTEKRTRTYIDRDPFAAGPFGYWSPYWRYYRPSFGWRYYDPFYDDPFWNRNVDVRQIDRYEAIAEIVLGRGPKPDNVRAFDARDVIERLGPSVELPGQR